MPRDLRRYQNTGNLHFITFSCYHRLPLLADCAARSVVEQSLERVRGWYGLLVFGYVVMPEHVHLLISEPERGTLRAALQMLKQISAHELRSDAQTPFWQARYYDFNVWAAKKRVEKLKYMHRNPVKRGLVERPEDWAWSSFLHYATGVRGIVEIESERTSRRRERLQQDEGAPSLSVRSLDRQGGD
jgi:putative transposase